jgi:subtilisin family serine protease
MRALVIALGAALACAPAAGVAAGSSAPGMGGEVAIIVHLRPSSAMPAHAAPGELAGLLRRRARHDQAPLLRFLRAATARGRARSLQPLWIDDSVALRARPSLIADLRRRADVQGVEPDRAVRIEPAALSALAAGAPSASVTATGAPTLWAQGQTGRGVVVAVLDTGVAASLPQLATQPGSWFDPYDEHTTPSD